MPKPKTWVIKLDHQPGGSRWQVSIWQVNTTSVKPTIKEPLVLTFENDKNDRWGGSAERKAREWAERMATSWEHKGDPWEVAEDSL